MSDATAVAMCERLGRAVASSHTDSFSQDLFQLRRRASRYQRPYQRQRVVVKVRLQRTHTTDCHINAAYRWCMKQELREYNRQYMFHVTSRLCKFMSEYVCSNSMQMKFCLSLD